MRDSFINPPRPADTPSTVEGEIRVTCAACRNVKLLDKERLISKGKGNVRLVDLKLRCTNCEATEADVQMIHLRPPLMSRYQLAPPTPPDRRR